MLTHRLVDALSSAGAEELLRFLRGFYYQEAEKGSISRGAVAGDESHLDAASQLGLIHPTRASTYKLSPLGYEVANFAKEYLNWLDSDRALPEGITPEMLSGQRVLDVGCSTGRHLINFCRLGAKASGIEFQHDYLLLSRVLAAREGVNPPKVARASAERLPFRSSSFDIVFCRLVINYVNPVELSLAEFRRVLAPGGVLILKVVVTQQKIRELLKSSWWGNSRSQAFRFYGLVNGFLLQTTGRQHALRIGGRMHASQSPTYPTAGYYARRLRALGFQPERGGRFDDPRQVGLFTARLAALPQAAGN